MPCLEVPIVDRCELRAVNAIEDIRRQLDVQEDNVYRGYVWAYES